MKRKKGIARVISWVLVLCMMFTLIPYSAISSKAAVDDTTAGNVQKVLDYAIQMKDANPRPGTIGWANGQYTWDTELKKSTWRYFNGVMMDAFLMTGNAELRTYVEEFYDGNIENVADSPIVESTHEECKENQRGYILNELDSVVSARPLFDLLNTTSADKYKTAIKYVYEQLKKQNTYTNCGGNYVHKQNSDGTPTSSWSTYPIGLDGLYMAETFLMDCATAIKAGKIDLGVTADTIYSEVYARFHWVAETMYDADTKLYHHGWNPTTSEGNRHFWSRGIGWYAMALVDTIEMMPEGQNKETLKTDLKKLFDGMLDYQHESGLWYNVVNRDATLTDNNGNKLETSGSSMMAYALMKAYNEGWVTEAKYGEAGLKAFNGVASTKITGSKGSYVVKDTYRSSSVCATDAAYCANPYTNDEAKGTAALIMASTLASATSLKLSGNQPTCITDSTTQVSVTAVGITALTVTDKASDITITPLLDGRLEAGYKVYDIVPTNYTADTTATVKIPAPAGVTADNVVVYHVGSTVEAVTSGVTVEDGYVSFTTNHFTVYAVGKAKATTGGTVTNPSNTATGTIPGVSGTQYVLDTDGIDSGATYLIVNANTATANALMLNGTTAKNEGQTVSIQNNIATIDANIPKCEWTITKSSNKYVVESVNTAKRYVKPGNDNLTSGVNKDGSAVAITISAKTNGQYEFNNTSSGITYYLSYSSNSWQRSETASSVYLFKKTTGLSAEKQVTFTVNPATVNLEIGQTQDLTKSILVDSTEATTSSITWESDNSAVVSVSGGTLTAKSAGTATITATLSAANGENLATPISVSITVTVKATEPTVPTEPTDPSNPYAGLTNAPEPYPAYPDDGAVRINKTALSTDFKSTGVTKIELNTAGISVKNGLDVILVVDVSNSMGWTDNWFEGKTADEVANALDYDKIPGGRNVTDTTAGTTEDKLDAAMKAAQDFTTILLADNKEGSASNNSISFVTFAGYDEDNIKTSATNIDSVQTVFTGLQDATLANSVFADTKFTNYTLKTDSNGYTGSVNYTLQIGQLNAAGTAKGTAVSGLNRGNTNYDYAFAEANKAVSALKSKYKDYAATGREVIVVFMTDGAPSHYNGDRTNGDKDDYLYGSTDTYPLPYTDSKDKTGTIRYTPATWLTEISKPNTYAQTLNSNINSFYALGFDLNHGGFTGFSWTQEELEPVLKNLAGENSVNVELADSNAALSAFYTKLANNIKLAGTYAKVTDIVDSNFTLQMTPFGVTGEAQTPSTIDVIAYDLWSKTETSDATRIGTRTGEKELLETITFSEDGTTAYSSTNPTVNIMEAADGTVTITAKYFTYTKDATTGKETFVWNIGDITDKEVALSYYAYLKGSMEGNAANGMYYTNESAILEYVDINGNYAKQTFRKPTVSWGSAITKVEYYLVNENGKPVNYANTEIPFANRIIIPHTNEPREFNWNESITISGGAYVPNGYTLYETDPKYTVIAYSGQQGVSNLVITDQHGTTKRIDEDTSCANTSVAFAVLKKDVTPAGYSLAPDQIVVDYGKPIITDVLANETKIPAGATASVIGFAHYRSDATLSNMQTNKGTAVYTGDYGKFSIENGNVKYTMTKMLDKVERVFVVVKVAKSETDYYYMYQELDVIPATVMYYETDFADHVFTFTNGTKGTTSWSVEGTAEAGNQDDGVVGTGKIYGYDSSYTTDSTYSNGASYKVEGEMDSDTNKSVMDRFMVQAKFTFTGTGFDLISRTGDQQGIIRVIIKNGTFEKSITVNNKSESSLELYQIPVVSVNDLTYGTYEVTIAVNEAYSNSKYPQLDRGGEFFFDAVRIFNPINTDATTEDASTAWDAYMTDGEAGATIKEVHQELITQKADTSTGFTSTQGVGFVDKGQGSVGLTDYSNIGPNNEVYLTKDQGLVFGINTNGQVPTSIDIGAKSADGSTVTMTSTLLKSDGTTVIKSREVALNTATAMFYDLADTATLSDTTYYVKIENKGTGILSITDVKVAYDLTSTPAMAAFTFFTDAMAISLMSMDFPVVGPEVTDPEVPEVTDPETPEEEETVIDSDCDIIDIEFNNDRIKLKKNAKLTFTTSDKVKTVVITDQYGNVVTEKISKKTKKGITTWKVEMKMTEIGEFTYTVTGYNEEGIAGTPAKISIGVYRK